MSPDTSIKPVRVTTNLGGDELLLESSSTEPTRGVRRKRLEFSWVLGVVAFTIARFFVAYGTLRQYGMNVWVFGVIDILTAVPYAVGTARLVTSLIDRRAQDAARWGMVAAGSFLAPYLYIAWAGRDGEFPPLVYAALALLVVCFGANAAIGVSRRVRAARRAVLTPVRTSVGPGAEAA